MQLTYCCLTVLIWRLHVLVLCLRFKQYRINRELIRVRRVLHEAR